MRVIWYNGCRGNWDHGLMMEIFAKHPNIFEQINDKDLQNGYFTHGLNAIIIVAGKPNVIELNEYLLPFKSGVVILTSEEDSYFDWKAAIPAHMDIWTQYYSPNKSEIKTRLLLGPPSRIKDYKINKHLPKKYLWSFVGQVQNPFRQQCVDVLKTLPDGFLHIAEAFGGEKNGVEYQEYLDIMCQSHYVICPAGSMCVDSFRLYEAMECGAVPITDRKAPRDPESFHYWNEVLRDVNPIGQVYNWQQLPGFLESKNPPSEIINAWWEEYKTNFEIKLLSMANPVTSVIMNHPTLGSHEFHLRDGIRSTNNN